MVHVMQAVFPEADILPPKELVPRRLFWGLDIYQGCDNPLGLTDAVIKTPEAEILIRLIIHECDFDSIQDGTGGPFIDEYPVGFEFKCTAVQSIIDDDTIIAPYAKRAADYFSSSMEEIRDFLAKREALNNWPSPKLMRQRG